MGEDVDGCMRRDKTASISVFLLEELGDARVRCAQLKKYLDEATALIEKSDHKDHIFELAGHLMHGIPEVLFKMEKAIEAASMAANRIDYEEIKERLKPEKVEELERALEDVRIRQLKHRSEDQNAGKEIDLMNAKTAAQQLLIIADQTEKTGTLPLPRLVALIGALEQGKKQASASGASPEKIGGYFRAIAQSLVTSNERPSRFALAQALRRVVGDQLPVNVGQVAAQIYQTANSREEVMDGFSKANPSMTKEQLEKAADMWEKHKSVVKDQHK